MRSENRYALAAAVAVLVVTAVVGASLAFTPAAPRNWLPMTAGNTFTASESADWVAHFSVGPMGGTLVGAWTAYNGSGLVTLAVANGTVFKPPDQMVCPLVVSRWPQQKGTVNVPLKPGPYSVYWTAGFCSSAQRILVTRSIEVLPA